MLFYFQTLITVQQLYSDFCHSLYMSNLHAALSHSFLATTYTLKKQRWFSWNPLIFTRCNTFFWPWVNLSPLDGNHLFVISQIKNKNCQMMVSLKLETKDDWNVSSDSNWQQVCWHQIIEHCDGARPCSINLLSTLTCIEVDWATLLAVMYVTICFMRMLTFPIISLIFFNMIRKVSNVN